MAVETQWTNPPPHTLHSLFFLCVCVSVEHVCMWMCAHASTSVSASVCMPPRFNYSSFPVQIWFGFSTSLSFTPPNSPQIPPQFPPFPPPSFVYYLLCWGAQCLGRIESRVAIMSLCGCHNYVLIQTHRKKVLAVCCSTQCCRVRHICLLYVSALIGSVCRLHYTTTNRQTWFSNTVSVSGLEWISVNP